MVGKMRTIMSILISLFITVILCAPTQAAQNPDFRLELDSLNLKKGASSTIVVSLINAQGAQVVSIEGVDDFDILSQSSSTSTSIVNNVATHQSDLYITVMPKTTGQFTLKANIEYDGKLYETNSCDVTVTEGSDNSGNTNPDLFVKTVLSHEEAYLGEKVVVTYEVYSRANVDSLGFTDHLTIDGVVIKELPDSKISYEAVYLDGDKYIKYIVKQLIIDPINTGVCVIPSFNLQVNVVEQNGLGVFGGMLQNTTPKYLLTDEVELLVKQLPSAGKPDNFSGIVGKLSMDGHYSRTELNYGDSLTLQIELAGNCNLDGIKSIFDGSLSDFTVYENQKETNETIENNMYFAKKAYEVILIPERNGTIKTQPVTVSYFNTDTEKYETVEIPENTIVVLGNMPQQNAGDNSQLSGGGYETMLINQVSYGNISDKFYNLQISKEVVSVIIVCALMLIAVGVIVILFVMYRRKNKTTAKIMYLQLMRSNDANSIYNSFNDIVKHCFGINIKASPKNSVIDCLPDTAIASQVTEIMSIMESTDDFSQSDMAQLKKKIKLLYSTRLRKIRQ